MNFKASNVIKYKPNSNLYRTGWCVSDTSRPDVLCVNAALGEVFFSFCVNTKPTASTTVPGVVDLFSDLFGNRARV